MQFFYWNASFEIGIPLVDAQHRRLVELINALAAVITDGGKLPQVEALINELMDYAAIHFSDEEKLMDGCDLPEGEKSRHRRAHRGFVDKVQQMTQRHDLLQADVAEQVLEFLTTWLVSHILGSDRKISQALGHAAATEESTGGLVDVPPVEQVLINALGETERRFRLISDYAPALIWVCDPEGSRGFFNRTWTDFVGIDERAAQNCDWLSFVHPEDRASYQTKLESLIVSPRQIETEYRLKRFDGDWGWMLERILPRHDANNAFMGLIAAATDISAIKRSEAILARANRELEAEVARRTSQLEQLMMTDPLTGVGNRRLLTNRLEEEIIRAREEEHPLTAIFFDLDHFKRINDQHGHGVGDRVLTRVAGCLRANLREGDFVGRYGGEEFVVLLPETPVQEAVRVVERLRGAIGRIRFRDVDLTVTASAGLAEWHRSETGDGLLARADRALYRAKESGRDRAIVDIGVIDPAEIETPRTKSA